MQSSCKKVKVRRSTRSSSKTVINPFAWTPESRGALDAAPVVEDPSILTLVAPRHYRPRACTTTKGKEVDLGKHHENRHATTCAEARERAVVLSKDGVDRVRLLHEIRTVECEEVAAVSIGSIDSVVRGLHALADFKVRGRNQENRRIVVEDKTW